MPQLKTKEQVLLRELARVAGQKGVVTGGQLRDVGFAEQVARIYSSNASFRDSLLSRKLQILRDKGYIRMERKNGGVYTILKRPET